MSRLRAARELARGAPPSLPSPLCMVLYYPAILRLLCCMAGGRAAARMALVAMKPAIISGVAMPVMVDHGDHLS